MEKIKSPKQPQELVLEATNNITAWCIPSRPQRTRFPALNKMNKQTLTTLGTAAREQYDQIAGNCRDIALTVSKLAKEHHNVSMAVRELHVGERRDTHFVNTLDAQHYADPTNGLVLVDATLDQYCSENQHLDGVRVDFGPRRYLPDVGIFPLGTEERHVWYYAPNDPNPGCDVFTGAPPQE